MSAKRPDRVRGRPVRVLLAMLLCIGCVHTYEVAGEGGTRGRVTLARGSSFLIGVSEDGRYGERRYEGSGMMTTQELARALEPFAGKVSAARQPAAVDDYLARARAEETDYLIVPKILHWEERATEWSGKPDVIEVRLTLIEVANGRSLDKTLISGKSKWATFGGDHPQDLLPEPLAQYAAALFQ